MSKNIEIEKRVMLDEHQYHKLLNFALSHENRVKLTLINHYFDDEELSLRKAHHMLRIRNINDSEYEMTLKIKGEDGDLEINEPIPEEEVESIVKCFKCKNKEINEHINRVTSKNIYYITSLRTERIEIDFGTYLFVLDKNYYSDVIDYDLEIEASSVKDAKETIKKYCDEFGMQYSKDYKSKSRRAINKALNI